MYARPARRHFGTIVLLLATVSGCQSPGTIPGFRLPWANLARNRPEPSLTEPADLGPLRPEQKADIQLALAITAERQGRTDDAKKMYLEIVKAVPKRSDVHHRLALLHDRKGDCSAAEPFYQQAIRLDPNNAELHCDLGYSYYLQQRWQEAEASLRRAIAVTPDLSRAHNNLGLLLGRTGRGGEALQEFAAAGSSPAEANANLAYTLALADRPDEAKAEFRRALEIDPNLKTARQGLASLDALAARIPAGSTTPAVMPSQTDVATAAYHEPVARLSQSAVETRISD